MFGLVPNLLEVRQWRCNPAVTGLPYLKTVRSLPCCAPFLGANFAWIMVLSSIMRVGY
tara:strand:+ start:4578 stop:4751 length:174 start_codon:yes stop_codon:yes gene_type:complete